MKHNSKLIWFDFFRGLAAFLVLISHVRNLLFEDYVPNGNPLAQFFYFITGFGHEAVILFFVLSGFFIIGSIHESVQRQQWSIRNYIINRLTRLWIVLLPSLLLTLCWDHLGLMLYSDAYTYAGTLINISPESPVLHLGITNFAGNLFFLQTILVTTFGSNGALWSLSNEFWYYVLFPILYFFFTKKQTNLKRMLLFFLFTSILLFVGKTISIYFMVWLLGGISYLLVSHKHLVLRSSRYPLYFFILLFMIDLVLIRSKKLDFVCNDFSLGIIFCMLLWFISTYSIKRLAFQKMILFFSNISYSLYLTHLSFSFFVVTVFFKKRMMLTPFNFLVFIGLLTLVLLYSYLIFFVFEKNTDSVKKYLRKRFS